MAYIPQSQRTMMLSQMTSQDLDALMDESKSSALRQYAERPDVISNQYVHDLYRFFKLSQRRHEFRDIFKEDCPAPYPGTQRYSVQTRAADYHRRFPLPQRTPGKALELYKELIALNHANARHFQKAGYCLQKEKRYKEAIDAYLKADVLKPDHVWTIRHLATCYRQIRTLPLHWNTTRKWRQSSRKTIISFSTPEAALPNWKI